MALRPFYFARDPFYDMDRWLDRFHRNMWEVDPWTRPSRLMDFGFGIPSNRLREMLEFPRAERLNELMRESEKEFQQFAPQTGKDGFQVCLDVQQFQPNEISVRTVDNSILIEGKHEERQDQHGYISRQFTRRYTLPKGYEPEKVVSSLSSDGILTIKAPPPQNALENSKERTVEIQQTGPARQSIKSNEEKK